MKRVQICAGCAKEYQREEFIKGRTSCKRCVANVRSKIQHIERLYGRAVIHYPDKMAELTTLLHVLHGGVS